MWLTVHHESWSSPSCFVKEALALVAISVATHDIPGRSPSSRAARDLPLLVESTARCLSLQTTSSELYLCRCWCACSVIQEDDKPFQCSARHLLVWCFVPRTTSVHLLIPGAQVRWYRQSSNHASKAGYGVAPCKSVKPAIPGLSLVQAQLTLWDAKYWKRFAVPNVNHSSYTGCSPCGTDTANTMTSANHWDLDACSSMRLSASS